MSRGGTRSQQQARTQNTKQQSARPHCTITSSSSLLLRMPYRGVFLSTCLNEQSYPGTALVNAVLSNDIPRVERGLAENAKSVALKSMPAAVWWPAALALLAFFFTSSKPAALARQGPEPKFSRYSSITRWRVRTRCSICVLACLGVPCWNDAAVEEGVGGPSVQ
jgi:hypothetical protein